MKSLTLSRFSFSFLLILVFSISGFAGPRTGHRGNHGYSPYRASFYGYPLWYGRGYSGCWSPWGYPFFYPGYVPELYRNNTEGAVDLNIKPKNAALYVDGTFVGKVRKFDGFPDYLWLPEGKHELIIQMDGYQTVRKEVEVVPHLILRANLKMVAGTSTPVEELSTAKANAEAERADLYARYSKTRPLASASGDKAEIAVGEPTPAGEASGLLTLEVRPADAAVYLDGRFLGIGSALAQDNGKIALEPGTHRLAISRPGYQEQQVTCTIEAGKKVSIVVELDPESVSNPEPEKP